MARTCTPTVLAGGSEGMLASLSTADGYAERSGWAVAQ